LKYPKESNYYGVKIKTFGSFFDGVVPNKLSKLENIRHKSFIGIHNTFLFSERVIKKIVKEIKK
jgi:hypothetical protein